MGKTVEFVVILDDGVLSFESALTFGEWDIDENWPKYKEEFLKEGQHG